MQKRFVREALHGRSRGAFFGADGPYLRSPLRRLFDGPGRLADELGVGPGQVVLDVGAGFGYFTLEAARRVGPGGLVYAVEPDRRRAAAIREACGRFGWVVVLEQRIEDLVWGARRPADRAIMLLSLHHVSDGLAALGAVFGALRAGGLLLVVEPRRYTRFGHGSTPGEVSFLLSRAGFRVVGQRLGVFRFKFWAQK